MTTAAMVAAVRAARARGFVLQDGEAELLATAAYLEATNDGCVAHDALTALAEDAAAYLRRCAYCYEAGHWPPSCPHRPVDPGEGCARCRTGPAEVRATWRTVGDGPQADVFCRPCAAEATAEAAETGDDTFRVMS